VVPQEFIGEADTVVALGEMRGTYKATGKSFKTPFVHVWRFSTDRLQSFTAHMDTLVFQRFGVFWLATLPAYRMLMTRVYAAQCPSSGRSAVKEVSVGVFSVLAVIGAVPCDWAFPGSGPARRRGAAESGCARPPAHST
jgi:hypothetical protein